MNIRTEGTIDTHCVAEEDNVRALSSNTTSICGIRFNSFNLSSGKKCT